MPGGSGSYDKAGYIANGNRDNGGGEARARAVKHASARVSRSRFTTNYEIGRAREAQ